MENSGEKISVDARDNSARISLNAKIYPKDVVYSAAYVFTDRAYIILGGDPEGEMTVEMRPKGDVNPEEIAMEFHNELLNYLVYKKMVEKTGPLRNLIVQRALMTASEPPPEDLIAVPEGVIETWNEDESVEDPENIAVPWDEKYGKKKR